MGQLQRTVPVKGKEIMFACASLETLVGAIGLEGSQNSKAL